MSKRAEIRQKEQLQLDLQAQFNKLDQTVLSWLKPKGKEEDKKNLTKDVINKDELKFGDQIIISSGKGIDFSNDTDKDNNINNKGNERNLTIDEFLNNVGNKNNRKDNKILKNDNRFNSKMNSNSIRALQNKLRNEKREVIKRDKRKEVKKTNIKVEYSSSDEDEDDEILSRKSNNSKNLNKMSKNKRPF